MAVVVLHTVVFGVAVAVAAAVSSRNYHNTVRSRSAVAAGLEAAAEQHHFAMKKEVRLWEMRRQQLAEEEGDMQRRVWKQKTDEQ